MANRAIDIRSDCAHADLTPRTWSSIAATARRCTGVRLAFLQIPLTRALVTACRFHRYRWRGRVFHSLARRQHALDPRAGFRLACSRRYLVHRYVHSPAWSLVLAGVLAVLRASLPYYATL